jgi:hypothetical protein
MIISKIPAGTVDLYRFSLNEKSITVSTGLPGQRKKMSSQKKRKKLWRFF